MKKVGGPLFDIIASKPRITSRSTASVAVQSPLQKLITEKGKAGGNVEFTLASDRSNNDLATNGGVAGSAKNGWRVDRLFRLEIISAVG